MCAQHAVCTVMTAMRACALCCCRYMYRFCLDKVYQIALAPFPAPLPEGEFDPNAGLHAYHQHVFPFQVRCYSVMIVMSLLM